MTTRRTFTAAEINRILNVLAGDEPYDLGGGLTAERTARKDRPGFRIDKGGTYGRLVEDSSPEELAQISAALWEKGKEFLPDDAASSTTPQGWEEKDGRFVCRDTDCGRLCVRKDLCPETCDLLARNLAASAEEKRRNELIPEELRDKPDEGDLEPDPTGLVPDRMRRTRAEAERDRRIADGTATDADRIDLLTPEALRDKPKQENRDDLLTPEELRDKPDPFAGTLRGLIPEELR